jgi:peptidoglycan hydrolase CwlO-like protein
MNAQFILLAQSVTAAVIEIVLLLIGAALIGFLTAWFYQKHFFTPIVKRLEAEKVDLNNQITGLKSDITDLNKQVTGLKSEIVDLNSQITGFKSENGKLNEKISGLEKSLAEKEKKIADLLKPKM